MDFGLLPPEVNSELMYAGPGSGPMLAAASNWSAVAGELESAADGYSSELTELTGRWIGLSSMRMAAAAARHVAWLQASAAQAVQTATQAYAAAAAYEAAFAMTVPPPVIAANRAQLMVLVATNWLGQNTPAIAATEAQYMGMWVEDATAMYGYAVAAETVSSLEPFDEPQQATNPSGQADQARAMSQTAANTGSARTQSAVQMASSNASRQPAVANTTTTPTTNSTSVGGSTPIAPGDTVTAPAGSTITLGENTGLGVNSGTVTVTGAGTQLGIYDPIVINPGSTVSLLTDGVGANGVLLPAGSNVTATTGPITLTPVGAVTSSGYVNAITVQLVSGSATFTNTSANLAGVVTANNTAAVTVAADASVLNGFGTVTLTTVTPAPASAASGGLGAATTVSASPLAGTAGIQPQLNAELLTEWARGLAGAAG